MLMPLKQGQIKLLHKHLIVGAVMTSAPPKGGKNNMSEINVFQIITERIILLLSQGIIPWRKPWTGTLDGAYSRHMKKPYSLLNQMLLGKAGEWLTYRQITQLGGYVNEGEKASIVVFWKILTVKDDNDEEKVKTIPVLRYYKVFHIDQTTGVKPLSIEEEMKILSPCEDAENVINEYISRSGVGLNIKASDRAFYDPTEDAITIPLMEQFSTEADYYSTAFHEIVHSTGHKTRFDRIGKGSILKQRDMYAKEELVAEIGGAALCHACNIETPDAFENSAAYIQNWLEVLRNDNRLIVQASGKAQKAVDYILNINNIEEDLQHD